MRFFIPEEPTEMQHAEPLRYVPDTDGKGNIFHCWTHVKGIQKNQVWPPEHPCSTGHCLAPPVNQGRRITTAVEGGNGTCTSIWNWLPQGLHI